MLYEINFLVLQSKTAELEKIRKETKKFIESYGAKITEEKEYLKRKLAYEIQHENYGFFTVLRFEFKKGTNLDELKVKLNQRNEVARYIIIRADELPSLEEDIKKLEKIYTGKKSIKSKDVEKALAEQKKFKRKTVTKKVKKETTEEIKDTRKSAKKKEELKTKKKETSIDTSNSAKVTVDKKTKKKKPLSTSNSVKTKTKKENAIDKKASTKKDNDVSLDELDKKLDEILNS